MEKRKKILKTVKIIAIAIFSLIFLFIGVVCSCSVAVKQTDFKIFHQGQLDSLQGYDYILVPGSGIVMSRPGTILEDRLNTAITLYKNGAGDKIFVSGAFDENQKLYEGRVMQIYLQKAGIPAKDIICDNYGVDTAETLRRAKAIIKDKRVIICTQSLYSHRTSFLANKYSINADIADSDIHIYTTDVVRSQIRETLAATKAVYDGIFVKKCKYSTSIYPILRGEKIE